MKRSGPGLKDYLFFISSRVFCNLYFKVSITFCRILLISNTLNFIRRKVIFFIQP